MAEMQTRPTIVPGFKQDQMQSPSGQAQSVTIPPPLSAGYRHSRISPQQLPPSSIEQETAPKTVETVLKIRKYRGDEAENSRTSDPWSKCTRSETAWVKRRASNGALGRRACEQTSLRQQKGLVSSLTWRGIPRVRAGLMGCIRAPAPAL